MTATQEPNPLLSEEDHRVLHQFFALQGDLKLFQEWWKIGYTQIIGFFRRPEIKQEVEDFRELAQVASDIRLADGLTAAIDELTRVIAHTPDNDLNTGRHAATSLIRLALRRFHSPKGESARPCEPVGAPAFSSIATRSRASQSTAPTDPSRRSTTPHPNSDSDPNAQCPVPSA